ncbi:MAG: GTP-binding protein, partial [Chitinophagaceae bacterium]
MKKNIRNFCIIAHIDHGKSTLADRLLEHTNTITEREMMNQVLDDMDLEREKGITIKSHAIQMEYLYNGAIYTFNLIDTPGHVDFSYEVSRALAACEGALLLVDCAQGIQAQTISNLYLALENDLSIIPIVNKIDMDGAIIEETKEQMIELLGCKDEDIILASGRSGIGIEDILEAVIEHIPAPKGEDSSPLQALIFDSVFNSFRGVIAYYRVFSGEIKKGDKIKFFSTDMEYEAHEVGILKMNLIPKEKVSAGDVGYVITGIKNANEIKVGDTITLCEQGSSESIHGFEEVKPMVFAGIFPINTDDFEELRDCMAKLQLNDASLTFEI